MKRNFHLIGEVNPRELEHLMEYLIVYDEIEDVIYNEQFRDLEIETSYKNVEDIIEHCIGELKLSIRVIERKEHAENQFEKRYFLFKNFNEEPSQLFLKSYLENDPTVESASYNVVENILTVDTSDPFIYNKISYVIKGMNENIEVEEIFTKKKFISLRFLSSILVVALFVLFAALTVVTMKRASFITEIGWVGMYGILVSYFAYKYYQNIIDRHYFSYSLVVMITTYCFLAFDYHSQAIIGVSAAMWLDLLYKEVVVRMKDRLIEYSNKLVTTCLKIVDGQKEVVNVVDIQKDDLVSYHSGDITHFNGIIQSGEAMIDTCFMSGETKLKQVNATQLIESGTRIVDGEVIIKAEGNYYQSSLYRLLSFNPKELKQHGYLITKYGNRDRIFALAMVIVGLIIMVLGVVFSDFGQYHFIVSGLVFMYLCYPFALLRLRPLLFQVYKQSTLKRGVVFMTEDALDRFLELADSNQLAFNNDELMKFHKGGYNVQEIVKDYTIIYEQESNLMQCGKLASQLHSILSTNKKILIITKLALSTAFLLAIFNFNLIIVIDLFVNFLLIVRSNRMVNTLL